jgi:hypothetical protein
VAEDGANGSGVVVLEVLGGVQGARELGMGRVLWQREDLEACAVKSNQVLGDERVSGVDVAFEGDAQDGADGIDAIEADPESVAGEQQENVEAQLVTVEGREETIPKEPVRQKGEGLAVDGTDSVRDEGRS